MAPPISTISLLTEDLTYATDAIFHLHGLLAVLVDDLPVYLAPGLIAYS